MASLAGALADGLRRAALLGDAVDGGGGDTGLLVLAADGTVEMANPAADRWLDELGAGDRPGGHLPLAVRAAASQARAAADGAKRGRTTATARACRPPRPGPDPDPGRTLGGGARLASRRRPGSRVAVLLEAARPAELAPLIADAYGLTKRERLVTELVAQGFSTSEIAARLHLSAYTVQDHLKSIFEKSGTGSRGGLVARLFFDHYAPRLRRTAQPPSLRRSDRLAVDDQVEPLRQPATGHVGVRAAPGRPRVTTGASSQQRTGTGAGWRRSMTNWPNPTEPSGRSNHRGRGGGAAAVCPGPSRSSPWSKVNPMDDYFGPYQPRR